jgi:hypothetical protein
LGTGSPKVSLDTPSARGNAREYHFEAFSTVSQPNFLTSPLQKTPGMGAFSALHELTGLGGYEDVLVGEAARLSAGFPEGTVFRDWVLHNQVSLSETTAHAA